MNVCVQLPTALVMGYESRYIVRLFSLSLDSRNVSVRNYEAVTFGKNATHLASSSYDVAYSV